MQIEGRNTLIESLKAGKEFKTIFIEDGINPDEKIKTILKLAKKRRINIKYKSKKYLNKISKTYTHQGVIGLRLKEEHPSSGKFIKELTKTKEPFIIYIREALYEHNIGAIVRTAEGAGADAVIVPPKAAITPQVVRISMGGTEHIPVIHGGVFQTIKEAKTSGLKVIGIEVVGEKYYYEEDLTGPLMLIIGGEDRPLSEEIIAKCDSIVKIPLNGNLNSLNMSVAASIVIYDKIRQEAAHK